ncbi:MAG: flagellar basal body L-ring protein, partial [Methylorubrum extorquens]
MRPSSAAVAVLALSLGACQSDLDRLGRPPLLTPIGTGLNAPREPLPTSFGALGPRHSYHSTWSPASAALYQDPRARDVG